MHDDVLRDEIRQLARQRDAVILAHNYQRPEVQDAADFVGDSLGLSRQAAASDPSVIVFAGVHFMAETAKILAPEKTVLLSEHSAGCPMADMISPDALQAWKDKNPGIPVVMYVNSSADVKALSDVCVTSANAVEVVRWMGSPKVLFGPDRNLAAWVASRIPEIEIVPWDGFCPTHERVTASMIRQARGEHPTAEVLVHPECRPEVIELADEVLSTSQMIRHAVDSEAESFIVATEGGLMHALRKAAPRRHFHGIEPPMVCPNMKRTTLESVRNALRDMEPAIRVAPDVRSRALAAVERMVAVG